MSLQIVWNVAANISYNQTRKNPGIHLHSIVYYEEKLSDREVVGGKQVSVRMSAASFAFTSI